MEDADLLYEFNVCSFNEYAAVLRLLWFGLHTHITNAENMPNVNPYSLEMLSDMLVTTCGYMNIDTSEIISSS